MKIKIIILLVSFFSFNAHSVLAENAVIYKNPLLHYSQVDTTLHSEEYPILSPLEHGTLKVLFIGRYGRVAPLSLEIMARLDCRIETVLTESRTVISNEDIIESNVDSDINDPALESASQRLERILRYNWDVIWLDFDINALPENLRKLILEHSSIGAGFVYVGDKKDVNSYSTRGKVDEEQLEVLTYDTIKTSAVRRDKGIIVIIPPLSSDAGKLEIGDYYNTAANSIFFSSAIKTETRIHELQMPRKQIELEVMGIMKYRVHFVRGENPDTLAVDVRFRNEKGETVNESSDKFIVQSGRSFIILDFPQLPIGIYSVDVSVSDSKGINSFAGTTFIVGIEDKIADVKLWDMSAEEGNFIIGSVQTTSELKEGTLITAELNDNRGQKIEEFIIDIVPGRLVADFAIKIKQSLSRINILKIRYYKNNELVQIVEKPIFIERQYNPYEFSFIAENDSDSDFLLSDKYKILASAGVNVFAFDTSDIQSAGAVFDAAVVASTEGTGIIPLFSNAEEYIQSGKSSIEEWEQNLKTIADTLNHIVPVAYSIKMDNKFDNNGNKEANTRATEKLKSLETLTENSYGDWMNSQRSGFTDYEQLHSRVSNITSIKDSTSLIGISGFNPIVSIYNRHNINNFGGSFGMTIPGLTIDRGISGLFSANMDNRELKGVIISGNIYNDNKEYLHYLPWYSLFNGMNGIWWSDMYGEESAAITPQLRLSHSFSIVADEVNEIMAGVDKLILKSKRHDDGILILYSPESIYAAYTSHDDYGSEQLPSKVTESMESFYHACSHLGFTPAYVSDSQLENSLLEDDNCSVLFLPYSQAVSDNVINIVKEFARKGGTVIADMRPAVMDENLSMRESGGMDEIFGISQSTKRVAPLIFGTFDLTDLGGNNMNISESSIECNADPTLEASDAAEIYANINGYPALIVNKYGEGRGIFLNMELGGYSEMRFRNDGDVYSEIISFSLEKGGIKTPFALITDNNNEIVPGAKLSFFKDGESDYIGFLAEPMKDNHYLQGIETIDIKINRTGMTKYIYDIRNGKFMGAKDNISFNVLPGRAELFALLPYRVQQLNLNLKTSVLHSGESLEFDIDIIPNETANKIGRHVFQIKIMMEDNNEITYYENSVETENGSYSASIPILTFEEAGKWILEVKDIISGKKNEKGFIVSTL